jgi:hypothetical protein
MLVYWLNMFRALVCPSPKVQYRVPLLVSKHGPPSELCSAGVFDMCTVQRMWSDCTVHTSNGTAQHTQDGFPGLDTKSGTQYCTPDDGHNCARNMLSQ